MVNNAINLENLWATIGAVSRNQNPISIQEQNPINSKKMKDISKLSEITNDNILNENKDNPA